jgi:hypothetical protein
MSGAVLHTDGVQICLERSVEGCCPTCASDCVPSLATSIDVKCCDSICMRSMKLTVHSIENFYLIDLFKFSLYFPKFNRTKNY